jgi:hypothetical protein
MGGGELLEKLSLRFPAAETFLSLLSHLVITMDTVA